MMKDYKQTCGFIFWLLLFLPVCLSGCTVGANYQEPGVSVILPAQWPAAEKADGQFDSDQKPQISWWRQFKDDELTRLIEQLFTSSLALAEARQRVVEVSARRGVVNADKWAQLSAAFGYTGAETGDKAVSLQGMQPGKRFDLFSAGLVAGWELDLWGRTARLLEAAQADVEAGFADYQAMMVSLAAELTLAYVDARTIEARLAMVRENINLQEKTLVFSQTRLKAGNGNALVVVRAEQLLQSTRARIPELQRGLAAAQNRINVLLGRPPRNRFLDPGTLPVVPPLIGIGLPADLLTRRPDIRRAVHGYHAAAARVGAAEAERYPALSLSGTLTLSSDALGGVLDTGALIYALGPGLRFPIFSGGRIKSTIAIRRSQAEQARLALEQKLVTVLAEVENAAVGVVRSQEQTAALEAAEKTALKSVALADSLYRAGLSDAVQVLDSQQELVGAQEALLLARQQALHEVVHLFRALGGGWQRSEKQIPAAEQDQTKQNPF